MKFDLKKSCLNCPFADTPDRITFACRERAEEIEDMAYRQGFVCHLHSEYIEEGEFETWADYVAGKGNTAATVGEPDRQTVLALLRKHA